MKKKKKKRLKGTLMVVYKSCPQMLRKHTTFLRRIREHTVDAQMWAGD